MRRTNQDRPADTDMWRTPMACDALYNGNPNNLHGKALRWAERNDMDETTMTMILRLGIGALRDQLETIEQGLAGQSAAPPGAIQTTCPEAPGPVAPTPTSAPTRPPVPARPDAPPGRPKKTIKRRTGKRGGTGIYERKPCCIDGCTHKGWRRGKTGLVCAQHFAEEQGMLRQISKIDEAVGKGEEA